MVYAANTADPESPPLLPLLIVLHLRRRETRRCLWMINDGADVALPILSRTPTVISM